MPESITSQRKVIYSSGTLITRITVFARAYLLVGNTGYCMLSIPAFAKKGKGNLENTIVLSVSYSVVIPRIYEKPAGTLPCTYYIQLH